MHESYLYLIAVNEVEYSTLDYVTLCCGSDYERLFLTYDQPLNFLYSKKCTFIYESFIILWF